MFSILIINLKFKWLSTISNNRFYETESFMVAIVILPVRRKVFG